MNSRLTLGFSPCPNDCFIFDAMVHGKVDTEGLQFDIVMADVEKLNRMALFPENAPKPLAVTKLSYAAYAYALNEYVMLTSGSALGFGVGPLLISKSQISNLKSQISNLKSQISNLKVAIPGKYTTANFLFSLVFPEAKNKVEMVFSAIEDGVLSGSVDAGVIIHENRFTYLQKGLEKIIDLGEWWENQTGLAIPLGGIAIKRNLPDELKNKVNRVLRRSVEFALSNPTSSLDFVKRNAQEMSEEVMYKHINLYVNKFSVDLGEEGKKAAITLLERAAVAGIVPNAEENLSSLTTFL